MQSETKGSSKSEQGSFLYWISGVVLLVIGLLGSATGSVWSEPAFAFFADIAIAEAIGTYAPYFPFVPFYPVFLIMLGAYLIVRYRR